MRGLPLILLRLIVQIKTTIYSICHITFADSLLFAWVGSRRFDSEIKFWRLFADVINDVGLTLELASPYFGRYFLLVSL